MKQLKVIGSFQRKFTDLETSFLKSETLEEFYLKELEKLQSKIKPEVFRTKPSFKKT